MTHVDCHKAHVHTSLIHATIFDATESDLQYQRLGCLRHRTGPQTDTCCCCCNLDLGRPCLGELAALSSAAAASAQHRPPSAAYPIIDSLTRSVPPLSFGTSRNRWPREPLVLKIRKWLRVPRAYTPANPLARLGLTMTRPLNTKTALLLSLAPCVPRK